MKTTVSKYDFERAFADADRKDQFSYEGLAVLFDYLEELEASTGQELELDVIALCCDYYESSTEEIIENYRIDVEGLDDDEQVDTVREYLMDQGAYCGEFPGGFVYSAF
jgi:predicted ArsR family transcriptional regulator